MTETFAAQSQEKTRFLQRVSRALRRLDPVAAVCLSFILVVVTAAVLADWLAPHAFAEINLGARKLPPVFAGGDWNHPFGTDELGRDILSRLMFAARTSLLIALAAAAVSAVTGSLTGLLAGYRGGMVDSVIRVAIDFQASMPFLIIALAVLAFLGNSLVLFVLLLGLHGWERYARLVRAMTKLEMSKGYVRALERNGASSWRIVFHHVLPNVAPIMLVNFTVTLPELLLVESGLSFLGLGVQPPLATLGNMVNFGRDYLITDWWIATIPGVVIFLLALSISMLGDWLRDVMDPTLR